MSCFSSWKNVIKSGTIEELDNNTDYVSELLLQPNLEFMHLDISFDPSSDNFRIMRTISENANKVKETDEINSENEEIVESSNQDIKSGLISFLNINNFPDAIFLEINHSNVPIFHIIELKRSPHKHLAKISKQFLAAYLHCKSIASFLHFDNPPLFKYYVAFNESIVLRKVESELAKIKYNKNNPKRTFVGDPPGNSLLKWYEERIIKFNYLEHSHYFEDIVNVPLTLSEEQKSIENPEKYSCKISV